LLLLQVATGSAAGTLTSWSIWMHLPACTYSWPCSQAPALVYNFFDELRTASAEAWWSWSLQVLSAFHVGYSMCLK